jgi:indolepyruvate decarboxylase
VGGFDTQLRIFERLTVASAVLDDPQTAFREIDRVFEAALAHRQPVYLELPRDRVAVRGTPRGAPVQPRPAETSDPEALLEALQEAVEIIRASRRPVILAGEEMHRFGLQGGLAQLVEKTNIPVASTVLGKSVFQEGHPRYLGVYEGAMGRAELREYVEESDCLILLGALLTEMNLGIYTARLDPKRTIYASTEKLSIHYHTYHRVRLADFLQGLLEADLPRRESDQTPHPQRCERFQAVQGQRITVGRLFERLNCFIDDRTVVIAEPGDALFAGVDLSVAERNRFLSPAYYTSLGFAVPAALGAQLAEPKLRPLVLVGDGAFQMTGMELSTIVRYGLNPIVVLLNNQGYGTERPMQDGSFNDVLNWRYSRLPDLLGAGQGFCVKTESQLDAALGFAQQHTDGFCLLDVQLDPHDSSPALKRLTQSLAERIHSPTG